MGTIVTLPTERRRRRAFTRSADEAKILLFMGVRYVRDLEANPSIERPQTSPRVLNEAPLALA